MSEGSSKSDVQAFEAPIIHLETGEHVSGYHLVNLLRKLPALEAGCEQEMVDRWEIVDSRIPVHLHMFVRLKNRSILLFPMSCFENSQGKVCKD